MECYGNNKDFQDEFGYCDCWNDLCEWHYWNERRELPARSENLTYKLHGRVVDCYLDTKYEDEYGYCDCWDNIRGQTVCGYWEYCEKNDK